MKDQTTKSKKTIDPKEKKKINWKMIVTISILIIVLLIGWFYQQYRADQLRRIEFQTQRQQLINFWKSQGLSDQQIQEKLQTDRPGSLEGKPSITRNVLRTFRHATGAGPGVRPQ